MEVVKNDGSLEHVDRKKIFRCVERACKNLNVDISLIVDEAYNQLYNKISTKDIHKATILAARSRIAEDIDYSYAAARLLLHELYREVFRKKVDGRTFNVDYRESFIDNIKKMVEAKILNEKFLDFDLDDLAEKLCPERDLLFKYLGIKTLYSRYLLKLDGQIAETPQGFWMRIAMGLCLNEPEKVGEVYNTYSNFYACPATPTLLNSGTTMSQLSSCYLSTLEDSIDGIYGTLHNQARLSKHAGGLGIDLTPLRGNGAKIRQRGKSSGVVPWAKQFNDMVIAVNQEGVRPGAAAIYLETWHIDIEEFIELRKNTGDERRRCHDLHPANWIPDEFMRRVENDSEWYLFSPDEVNLHELHSEEFTKEYNKCISSAKLGKIKNFKIIKAKELWKKMIVFIRETGHPWITFKDVSNFRYSNQHVGVVHNSNLCCVTGDQRVASEFGLLTVKELYELNQGCKLAGLGKIVDGSQMELTIKDAEVVKIETEEGYEHKVTKDHPVWVENVGWVEAAQLKSGDIILLQNQSMFGNVDEPELAFICGLIAGDGTFSVSSAIIDLWDKDLHLIPLIEDCVKRILVKHRDKFILKTTSMIEPKFVNTGKKARLSSSPLQQILKHFGFTKETKLSVPDFVFRGNKSVICQYLLGLYLSDATVQANETSKVCSISLCSINKTLLRSAQLLLLNLGIKSQIYLLHDAKARLLPDGNGGYKEYNCQSSFRLNITSLNLCKLFDELVQLSKYKKMDNFLLRLENGDGYKNDLIARIKSVTAIPNEDVYCLMVNSDDRAWTCNGFITKNTEILLHTKPTKYSYGEIVEFGETAVCNLASLNLIRHYEGKKLNKKKLAETIRLTVRMLDNVIDLNFYPTQEARKSNMIHRPIGLGIMGWNDVCDLLEIERDSDEAVKLADELQEFISYHAIKTSAELAGERGKYASYEGSLWSKNIFPIDSYNRCVSPYCPEGDCKETLDWEPVRELVRKNGMRNSNVMAIAPTATISYIQGCSQSIEPNYSALFTYSNLSGEATMLNPYFVEQMKKHNLWTERIIKNLQSVDGDVTALVLPAKIKSLFKPAFKLNQLKLIDVAAARQKWIDQGQSLNIYYDGQSMKELSNIYFHAWKCKLKTTYYLHSKAASKVEKSFVEKSNVGTCTMGEVCESCQ